VHVLVNYPPKVSVSSLVNNLKGVSPSTLSFSEGEVQCSSTIHVPRQLLQQLCARQRIIKMSCRRGLPVGCYVREHGMPARTKF